jgi:signal transduction histidine kinase
MMTGMPVEQLRKIDLFKGLTDEELLEIGRLCSQHHYGAGEICISENDKVNNVHFVKEGEVAVEIHIPQSPAENKVVIDILKDGEVFAWSALVTSTLTASVRTLEPTEVLEVNAAALLDLCERIPHIGFVVMKNLTFVINSRLTRSRSKLGEAYRDLRESQEKLFQTEKLTSLGQMASAIAHEINNPLAGVLVYTKLLSKKIKDSNISTEVILEYLSKMDIELTRSAWLVRNLLDFSRQTPPVFREFEPNDVINRALDITSQSVELKNIEIIKELKSFMPRLMADFDQITQVCTHLIINAIQAMPQGGKLFLRTSKDGAQLKIEIQDTGYGIPPENMPKLFTPFFSTKREVKGVGLGLAVSHGIIERHRGRIEVQSKMGEGSTFTIYLPFYHEKNQ